MDQSSENALLNEAQNMQQQQEALLRSRELFYKPLSLEQAPVYCGDERESDFGVYVHVFGGMSANLAYTYAIMREALEPGTHIDTTFAADVAAVASLVKNVAGITSGVHSNEAVEDGRSINPEVTEDIDCGFLKKRAPISAAIAANAEQSLADAKDLCPELFTNPEDEVFAKQVIGAHMRLAERVGYFTTGRDVAKSAMAQGETSMTVRGAHSGRDGIYNKNARFSLDSTAASQAGMPTYEHNGGATAIVRQHLHDLYPYDVRQTAIADVIDAAGTMRVLGVETIAARD